ncbi:RNA-binding S4 domain-containing protein [Pannonibacter tanglangensis]|uniref:RNA-binding S4 domain-containing protein n=1 Tax=Pannonibacter tanglangensis TaxID=2750084 RepID=A0ABW9ZSE9_9HYPH|nr:RNA-binding S4 domain-containing protein [Pannonibacter sp. XCT-34]NBN65957.1 RNA-binding S4 domain-containing protein [Pannonibacter sp. XCT-34]
MSQTPPAGPQPSQRIDKWLWFARVTKSRTLAQKLATGGHVRVNRDKIDSASKAIRIGDVLTIALERRVLVLEVLGLGNRRGPAPEAHLLYRDLSPPPPPRESGGAQAPVALRDPGAGRPTKRDRRRMEAFTGGFADIPVQRGPDAAPWPDPDAMTRDTDDPE